MADNTIESPVLWKVEERVSKSTGMFRAALLLFASLICKMPAGGETAVKITADLDPYGPEKPGDALAVLDYSGKVASILALMPDGQKAAMRQALVDCQAACAAKNAPIRAKNQAEAKAANDAAKGTPAR